MRLARTLANTGYHIQRLLLWSFYDIKFPRKLAKSVRCNWDDGSRPRLWGRGRMEHIAAAVWIAMLHHEPRWRAEPSRMLSRLLWLLAGNIYLQNCSKICLLILISKAGDDDFNSWKFRCNKDLAVETRLPEHTWKETYKKCNPSSLQPNERKSPSYPSWLQQRKCPPALFERWPSILYSTAFWTWDPKYIQRRLSIKRDGKLLMSDGRCGWKGALARNGFRRGIPFSLVASLCNSSNLQHAI